MLNECSTKNTHFRCLCTGVATPTLTGGDASVHIPYYLRRRTGSKILVYWLDLLLVMLRLGLVIRQPLLPKIQWMGSEPVVYQPPFRAEATISGGKIPFAVTLEPPVSCRRKLTAWC